MGHPNGTLKMGHNLVTDLQGSTYQQHYLPSIEFGDVNGCEWFFQPSVDISETLVP